MRSKHGRDKLFETPELLWEAAAEYFQWCDDHPLQSTEYLGKDAKRVIVPKMRAYTLTGLALYVNASESFWREFRKNPNLSHDYLSVITRIEDIIRTQKFEGAAAGLLKENIISRELGLKDSAAHELSGPGGGPIQTERYLEIDYESLPMEVLEALYSAIKRPNDSQGEEA